MQRPSTPPGVESQRRTGLHAKDYPLALQKTSQSNGFYESKASRAFLRAKIGTKRRQLVLAHQRVFRYFDLGEEQPPTFRFVREEESRKRSFHKFKPEREEDAWDLTSLAARAEEIVELRVWGYVATSTDPTKALAIEPLVLHAVPTCIYLRKATFEDCIFTEPAVSALESLLHSSHTLEDLGLGMCEIDPRGFGRVCAAVGRSESVMKFAVHHCKLDPFLASNALNQLLTTRSNRPLSELTIIQPETSIVVDPKVATWNASLASDDQERWREFMRVFSENETVTQLRLQVMCNRGSLNPLRFNEMSQRLSLLKEFSLSRWVYQAAPALAHLGLTTLTVLKIEDCRLNEQDIEALGFFLVHSSSLSELAMRGNIMPEARVLARGLRYNKSLQRLRLKLDQNFLHALNAERNSSLVASKALSQLEVGFRNCELAPVTEFLTKCIAQRQLATFKVFFKSLSNPFSPRFFELLSTHPRLRQLELNFGSHMYGSVVKDLATALTNPRCRIATLCFDRLSNEDVEVLRTKVLPGELVPSLRRLQIHNIDYYKIHCCRKLYRAISTRSSPIDLDLPVPPTRGYCEFWVKQTAKDALDHLFVRDGDELLRSTTRTLLLELYLVSMGALDLYE